MTAVDFNLQFDILYNSISSNQAPSINSYEKSVFLTLAQEDIVLELYRGSVDTNSSFESTEETKEYLRNLIRSTIIYPSLDIDNKISKYSTIFKLPTDILFIIYESIVPESSKNAYPNIDVVPVTLDKYYRIANNPFRKWNSKRALRLENSNLNEDGSSTGTVEIIYDKKLSSYNLQYLSMPNPIIVEDLGESADDLNIRGEYKSRTCLLHPALHKMILERAVSMAIQAMNISSQTNK